jgi:hypothetical protein
MVSKLNSDRDRAFCPKPHNLSCIVRRYTSGNAMPACCKLLQMQFYVYRETIYIAPSSFVHALFEMNREVVPGLDTTFLRFAGFN